MLLKGLDLPLTPPIPAVERPGQELVDGERITLEVVSRDE